MPDADKHSNSVTPEISMAEWGGGGGVGGVRGGWSGGGLRVWGCVGVGGGGRGGVGGGGWEWVLLEGGKEEGPWVWGLGGGGLLPRAVLGCVALFSLYCLSVALLAVSNLVQFSYLRLQ